MSNFFRNTFAILVLIAVAYFFRNPLVVVVDQMKVRYFPCRFPVTYRIERFDTEFGLSREDFLSALADAEEIWEKPMGKNLFQYEDGGSLRVNLIYDERQEATEKLEQVENAVRNNKEAYDDLVSQYNLLNADYQKLKATFESRLSAFNTRKAAYEAEVDRVNDRGGADKQTYNRLNAEKEYLSSEMASLSQMQSNLNNRIIELNNMTAQINRLATNVNANVRTYNRIGENLGEEFDEGLYKSDISGQEIDIYQFDSRSKLVRVLAHELGHALGLEHIDDPNAIMYWLNNGFNEKATESDLVAARNLCGI